MKYCRWGVAVLAAALLAACGGGEEPQVSGGFVVKGSEAPVASDRSSPTLKLGPSPTAPAAGNALDNGGFESGTTGWQWQATGGTNVAPAPQVSARSGTRYGWMGGADQVQQKLSQVVAVPASGTPKLEFWYYILTDDGQQVAFDELVVEVFSLSGSRLATLQTLSNKDAASTWKPSPQFDLSAYRGQTVELRFTATTDISGITSFLLDDVSLSAAGVAAQPANGSWWNPAESGRGFFIDRQGNQISVGAYLYEESGAATWYSALATQQADGSYAGELTRYAGGQTLQGNYKAPASSSRVGSIVLTFSSTTRGTVQVQPAGSSTTRTIPIELFTVGPNTASNASFANGTWWNESESGRGFVIEVQGNTVMLGSFMYEASGQPVWYQAAGPLTSPSSFTLALSQMAGGQALNQPYRAPSTVGSPGSLSFQAQSSSTATLTLPGGRQVPLKRLIFNSAAAPSDPPPSNPPPSNPPPSNPPPSNPPPSGSPDFTGFPGRCTVSITGAQVTGTYRYQLASGRNQGRPHVVLEGNGTGVYEMTGGVDSEPRPEDIFRMRWCIEADAQGRAVIQQSGTAADRYTLRVIYERAYQGSTADAFNLDVQKATSSPSYIYINGDRRKSKYGQD